MIMIVKSHTYYLAGIAGRKYFQFLHLIGFSITIAGSHDSVIYLSVEQIIHILESSKH
jgi:hypothetical protein